MANNINFKKKDYSKTKIYVVEPLVDHPPEHTYYGSTTKQYLSQRMSTHRGLYKNWKAGKGSNFYSLFDLIDIYGLNTMKIYLVENYPCTTKDEKASREGFYIRTNKCINKNIPGRTKEEYYTDNKDKCKEYQKEYHKQDKCKEYQKEYQKQDKYKDYKKEYQKQDKYKDYKKEYSKTSKYKDYHKDYCKTSKYKDYQKEYKKLYYQKKKQEKASVNNNVSYDADNETTKII
jgi:hypothetical protein